MDASRQVDDGPAVLQLCRWTLSQTHLKLSKFREVFISPTRRLFGLLSDYGDLVLATVEVNPSQVELPKALSDTCTQAVFETFSSIPRVKSLAWGYCSDASSQLEDSSFNEVLVVSSDASITVHAFCRSRKSTLTVNSTSDPKELHGEWKEWRPTECSVLEDGESGPKNWFCSFLTTITASVSNGKYQARFPMKALLPHSAEVVSFNLYDTTLSFLKFWFSKCSPKTMMETDSESSQSFFSSLPVDESSCSCQWECLKVLSSSSGHLIGLVLTPNESVTCEAHTCNTECVLVAVLELHQWGIQWNFVANLQDARAGIKPSPKWVDFQLSDMFLACLNATGFVAIWDVKTGGLATSFSALQRCRTGLVMPLRSSMPDVTNLDGGNISVENFAGRMFKRLVLASCSHLLAVVDEVGVVYVFYADDTLNFKANVHENFDLSVMNHFGDCLSAWEAAGHEIGSLSFTTHQSIRQGSLNPAKWVPEVTGKNDVGIVRPRKRRKCRCDENEVDSWPSGFIATGKMKVGAVYPDTVNSSSSLRRVLLPPCRSKDDVISLSPLGLMRAFKSSNADGSEHVKIFHTELLMYSSFLGERDIDAGFMDKRLPFKKDSAFVGDSVVCSFQGYLYLITQYGLSVVLPPVSISSFSSHGDAIKFWQSGFAVSSTCNALNLLSVDRSERRWKTWQIEVLDRALLYEGPSLADRLCWENGVFSFSWLYLFVFICVNILLHGWSCCSILNSFLILWSVFTLLNISSWICFH
jgi:spatacsin